MEPWQFRQKQSLPYEAKIRHAEIRAREFKDWASIHALMTGQKFVIDGLVAAGVLQGDGWKYIKALRHDFRTDKASPRVEVTLKEVG